MEPRTKVLIHPVFSMSDIVALRRAINLYDVIGDVYEQPQLVLRIS